jgi:putative transposase
MEYRRNNHSVYYTRYHVVVSTRYRRKIFNPGMGEYLKIKVIEITKHYPEIEILEVNTDEDHMHVLLSIPPQMQVSYAVNVLKTNTGKAMRAKFPFLNKTYWGSGGIWSIGYFVSTVGINEETIKRYIEFQGTQDSGQAKLEL